MRFVAISIFQYDGMRYRTTGYRPIIEVHLWFPHSASVSKAHPLAALLEERFSAELECAPK